jgi:hypothetical protein
VPLSAGDDGSGGDGTPTTPTSTVTQVGDAQWSAAVSQVSIFLNDIDGSYTDYQQGGGDQNSYYDDHGDSSPLPQGMLEMFGWMPHVQDMEGAHFYDFLTQDMDAELIDYQGMALQYSGGSASIKSDGAENKFTIELNGTLITVERHEGTGIAENPGEIVVNGVSWEVQAVNFNYDSSPYIMASYGGNSSGGTHDTFTTPGGATIKTVAHLSAAQQATMGRIVDLGLQRNESAADISIAVKMAFQESSFDNSASAGSHHGLYEYDQATWERYGGTGSVTSASVDAQISVLYNELHNLHDRYTAGYSSTLTNDSASAVPRDITFEHYAKIKHEGGPNDYSFHSPTEQNYWNAYVTSATALGAAIYYHRT